MYFINKSFELLAIFTYTVIKKFNNWLLDNDNEDEVDFDQEDKTTRYFINQEFKKLGSHTSIIFKQESRRSYRVTQSQENFYKALVGLLESYERWKDWIIKDNYDYHTLSLFYEVIEKSFVMMFLDTTKVLTGTSFKKGKELLLHLKSVLENYNEKIEIDFKEKLKIKNKIQSLWKTINDEVVRRTEKEQHYHEQNKGLFNSMTNKEYDPKLLILSQSDCNLNNSLHQLNNRIKYQ